MEETGFKKILKWLAHPFADLNSAVQILRLTSLVLAVIAIILGVCLSQALSRQQLIVGVDPKGEAVPLRILQGRYENLINYQQFLKDFLDRIYSWDSESYKSQIESAMALMAPATQDDYLKAWKSSALPELVEKGDLVSAIQVKFINREQIKPLDSGGWEIQVDAIKFRLIGFKLRNKPTHFTIQFKTCPLSVNNIWGFQVIGLKEQEMKEVIEE